MTLPQLAILALLLGLLLVFATDRFRVELVALAGLAGGVVLGVVPFVDAFDGFSNAAVITVAEILILTRVIARSHLMDLLAARLGRAAHSERSLLALVCGLGAFTSVFMNNIGALALWVPVALSLCRSTGVAPGRVLMPLSFATLLGGTCSLIGTPANLVVSNFQAEATGQPFGFFDLAWVGVPITVLGVLWLVVAAPRLMAGRGLQILQQTLKPRFFFTELRVLGGSPLIGASIADAEQQLGGRIHAQLRGDRHVFGSRRHREVQASDILLLEADAQIIAETTRLREAEFVLSDEGETRNVWTEAVVLPQSVIIGSSARTITDFASRDIQIAAIATRFQRSDRRLADLQIRVGDVLLLYGRPEAIAQALDEVDCLALSPQTSTPVRRQAWFVLSAFIAAIALAATNLVPPEIAFGAAVLVVALTDIVDLRAAMAELNWAILIMLAAMIPLGDAVANTGLADLIAHQAVSFVGSSQKLALTATVLISAAAITPFVNNVSAAVALAPIAVALAKSAGISPEPFLIAVAIGVSLDFVTPFGHHNNTLVMSIGTYRFSDFLRLGLPLTLGAGALAVLAIHAAFG